MTQSLYEQYANQIFRYCLHQLGSREEAEDAVQSTFLNAFRGIKRGVVPELESAWLFKIAHNVCLSRRRSAWRRGRIESPADFDVVEELAPAPTQRADELIGLQDVLEGMPDTQRRAILLREWQGLSYREIAGELELSQAAVETLIFRARRSLASGLEQPVETRKRRGARAFDWGNVVAALKSALVGGSVAAKVAATVAVVSATTVAAAGPVVQHRPHHQAPDTALVAKRAATSPARHKPAVAVVAAPVVRQATPPASAPAAPRRHAARRSSQHAAPRHVAPAVPAPTQPVAAPVAAPQAATMPVRSMPPKSQGEEHSAKQGNLPVPQPSGEGASHGNGNAWGHEHHLGAPTGVPAEHGQSTGAEPVPPVATPSGSGDEQTSAGQPNGHGNGKGGN